MERFYKKMPALMMIFIMFQPVLDIFTSYSKVVLNMNITPGIIIRFLILFLGMLYILMRTYDEKQYKHMVYIIILGIFFFVNLFVSYKFKPIFNLFDEIIAIGKIVYFVLMFLIYLNVFNDFKIFNKENKYFPKNIMISQLIISASMVISDFTNTNIEAYHGLLKSGNSGWFFAANELGSLIAICLPIITLFSLYQKSKGKFLISWLIVLGSCYSLIELGTKVGYLSIVITIIMLIASVIIERFLNNDKQLKINFKLKIPIVLISMFLFVVTTPYMPVTKNTDNHLTALENQEPKEVKEPKSKNTDEDNEDNKKEKSPKIITDLVYSGRDSFEKIQRDNYRDANNFQKIFGLGYGANYRNKPKTVERDFHDIFYQFGILGTTLIFFPFLIYGFNLFLNVVKNYKKTLIVKLSMLITSILLGFGIAFISGHTLTAPAVSTYFSLIFAYTCIDFKYNRNMISNN